MKYVKMLGLLAVAAAALMAFAGSAAATTLTSPTGTVYTGTIHAEAEENTILHNSSLGVSTTCKKSTAHGHVETHGAGVTAGGKLTSLTFSECDKHVTVLNPGELKIHWENGYNGILTSIGAEITIQDTGIGISCIYKTSAAGTEVGTLTGKTEATLDINSAIIPRTGHSAFCGSSGKWTGSYKVTSPHALYVDP